MRDIGATNWLSQPIIFKVNGLDAPERAAMPFPRRAPKLPQEHTYSMKTYSDLIPLTPEAVEAPEIVEYIPRFNYVIDNPIDHTL